MIILSVSRQWTIDDLLSNAKQKYKWSNTFTITTYNFTSNVILAFNTRLFCGLYKAFIHAV